MSDQNEGKGPQQDSRPPGAEKSRRRRGRRRPRGAPGEPGTGGEQSAQGQADRAPADRAPADRAPADRGQAPGGPADHGAAATRPEGATRNRRNRRRRPRPTAEQADAGAAKSQEGAPPPAESRTAADSGGEPAQRRKRRRRKRPTEAAEPSAQGAAGAARGAESSGPAAPRTVVAPAPRAVTAPAALRPRQGERPPEPSAPVVPFEALPPLPRKLQTIPADPTDPDGDDIFMLLGEEGGLAEGSAKGQLVNAVPIGLRNAPQLLCDAGDLRLERQDRVLVETDRGLSVGVVIDEPMRCLSTAGLPRVLSVASDTSAGGAAAAESQREAFTYCRERIRERDLPMKLVDVELVQNGSKALFYFSAENRVDFRDLVKDLARKLHARIEMRQIGVRDEARMSSGLGPCGLKLCCSTWIKDFHPVSIRMAKDQNIVLNPTKVSGMCGRLKCCLAYEQQLYREARSVLPKVGQRVRTPAGEGRVHELDIPRQLVRVLCQDGAITTFQANEVHKES